MDLKGYNGNCIGFNVNYNGAYWYLINSIGGCNLADGNQ